MAKVVQGVVTREMDTSKIFEKFTIEEIREIEKKTRSDIERKKEDLRTMVGERYRDLIEAADTIAEMKDTASKVSESVGKIQSQCQRLQHTHLVQGVSVGQQTTRDIERKKEEKEFYGIATQIKLLLDMPEKIWSAMDDDAYLRATRLFLLARHINTGLQMDSQQSAAIVSWFPVLVRQWAAISQFKTTILQGCRQLLKQCGTSEQMMAECMCSIMLLEDSTPRQVFTEFLLARTSAIQQLLQADTRGIKSQICDIVEMIITTIYQIHAIFYCPTKPQPDDSLAVNLLVRTLESVTRDGRESQIIDTSASVALRHLPTTVTAFRPSLRSPASSISWQHLQDSCVEWMSTCVQDVHAGITRLLVYVTNVKALAGIRDDVWDFMDNAGLQHWGEVCKRLLKREVSVWEEFVQPLCLARIQAIVESQFDSTLSANKNNISKVLTDLSNLQDRTLASERDLSQFVWHESVNDIPANSAWVPAANKTLAEGGGLAMKAKAYTPAVQKLCQNFDGKLKVLLQDLHHYTDKAQTEAARPADHDDHVGPFDRYADTGQIRSHLQTTCQHHMQKLKEHIEQQLRGGEMQLKNNQDPQGSMIMINRLLLLGRLCGGLCELAPHLQQCIYQPSQQPRSKQPLGLVLSSKAKPVEDPLWTQAKSHLLDTSQLAFRMWSGYTTRQLLADFERAMSDPSGQAALAATTQWDDIQIQEETEDGKTIKSTIRVPMQGSWCVQSLLYTCCTEVNRVAGHSLSRVVLGELVERLCEGTMGVFESCIKRGSSTQSLPLSQTKALQMIFDVKFLAGILGRKDDSNSSKAFTKRVTRIVEGLESCVDPFDLDVFSPFMQSHLSRQIQRSSVLFGCLTSLDRHSLLTSRVSSTGGQEQHNVLPLATCNARFNMLPLSTQTSRGPLQQPLVSQNKVPMMTPPHSMSTLGQDNLPVERDSGSFFNQVSTIWFSNIGSKNT